MNFAWRRPLTHGALLLMETLWVYALLAAIVAVTAGTERPTILAVGAVVFGSYCIARGLQGTLLDESLLRWWGVLLSILVFYMIVRVDFFSDFRFWDFGWADTLINTPDDAVTTATTAAVGIPLLWVFWVRGVLRGQQELSFDSVVSSFAIGLLVVGLAELIAEATDAPNLVRYVAVPYIAIGLLTVGLAHASRAEHTFGRSFAPTWLIGIAGSIIAIALIALLFALLDLDTAQNALGFVSGKIAYGVGYFLYIILYPFVYATLGVLHAIRWVLHTLLGDAPPREIQPPVDPNAPPPDQITPPGNSSLPDWARIMSRSVILSALFALIFYAFAKIFVRRVGRKPPTEVRESTYQEGRLASDLGAFVGSLFGFLGSRGGRAASEPIRRLYFEMLALAARRGVERSPPETPLELQPRVSQTLGPAVPAQLTHLFDESRYGGRSPPASEVQRLRQELDGLSKS